jgi:hypothetical protein
MIPWALDKELLPKIDFGKTFEEVGIMEIYEIAKNTRSRVLCKIAAISPINENERNQIIESIKISLKNTLQQSKLSIGKMCQDFLFCGVEEII